MQVNIFDIAVCRIIHYYLIFLAIHTMTRTELMQWLTSLKIVTFTSSQVQDHELDRLISVLKELSFHSNNHPSFLERAIDFARFMKPKNVSSFCSFLMFFATTFVSERDTQMQNAHSNKRITKKEAGIGISYFEIRMIRKIKPLFFA